MKTPKTMPQSRSEALCKNDIIDEAAISAKASAIPLRHINTSSFSGMAGALNHE